MGAGFQTNYDARHDVMIELFIISARTSYSYNRIDGR